MDKYKSNIAMLKDSPLFKDSKMDLHEAVVQPDGSVLTRWTLAMTFKAFPWQPRITFTGTSTYFLDSNGLVSKHVDMWDSIDNQSPVSFQALSDLISQMLPDITKRGVQAIKGGAAEEITHTVIRRAPGLEIRRFDEFETVATEDEGVYSKETYNEARNLIRDVSLLGAVYADTAPPHPPGPFSSRSSPVGVCEEVTCVERGPKTYSTTAMLSLRRPTRPASSSPSPIPSYRGTSGRV